MAKHVVNNEKNRLIAKEEQSISRLKKPFHALKSSHEIYVKRLIEMGKQLIIEKENVGKGDWERVVRACSEHAFGSDHAGRIMRIAANEKMVLEFFSSDTSIRQICDHISTATPEQVKQAEELTQADVEKSLAEKTARYEEAQAKKSKAEQDKKDGIIDGEFSEVKAAIEPEKINIEPKAPKPEPEKTSADLFHEEVVDIIDTQEQINLDLSRENSRLEKIISSDDNVAFLLSENARLTRELADMTNSSNRHMANAAKLQGENNGLRDQLKRLRKESKVIVK